MLNADEWVTLIETLMARTESGRAKWQPAPGAAYSLPLGKNDALVLDSVDGDGNAPFELKVYHRRDESSERTLFAVLSTEDDSSWAAGGHRLAELYNLVSRQVSGVSSVFKGILDSLGGPVETRKPAEKDDPWSRQSNGDSDRPF